MPTFYCLHALEAGVLLLMLERFAVGSWYWSIETRPIVQALACRTWA